MRPNCEGGDNKEAFMLGHHWDFNPSMHLSIVVAGLVATPRVPITPSVVDNDNETSGCEQLQQYEESCPVV